MDWLARIFEWLREQEAGFSAVAAIVVIAGVVFAGFRWLLSRRGTASADHAPAGSAEAPSAIDSSSADLDPLTVPGFEGRPAIAVLPFDNLSGDPEQEYFADGIAEDLITRLSAWRTFPVIARNSSFTYKGKAVDVKQVSRELGVRYVVEGSVRKAGDRIRIAAQLIDATTGAHVWAETYDRKLEDIFAIQDEITIAIAASIGEKLAVTESERVAQQSPVNLTAYDLFMQGRRCALQGWTEGNFRARQAEARALFERAIEINPRYAAAFAWLAATHHADWFSSGESSAQLLAESERAARRSVSLDPELPVAHLALSYTHALRGNPDEALAAARRAIELDPSLARAYLVIGFYLAQTGNPDEAIAILEKAIRLSPRDPSLSEFTRAKGKAHFAAGRYVEAVECGKQSIAQGAPLPLAWVDLAASQAHLGEIEEAKAALREAEARMDGPLTARGFKWMFSLWDAEIAERWLDGLRKAGLPEGTEA